MLTAPLYIHEMTDAILLPSSSTSKHVIIRTISSLFCEFQDEMVWPPTFTCAETFEGISFKAPGVNAPNVEISTIYYLLLGKRDDTIWFDLARYTEEAVLQSGIPCHAFERITRTALDE